MNTASSLQIFINAAFINNFVLALFLGICPFLASRPKRIPRCAWAGR